MDFQGAGAPATREGILAVLDTLNVRLPQLLAVVTVETSGCGCLADRRPAILFERHIFSKQTGHKFDAQHPDISNPTPGAIITVPPNTTVWAKPRSSTVRPL
jgi:deoxycytidine triphosphate deaminase